MGMLNWYKESDSNQKKTFWACYAGWALDSYDMQILVFITRHYGNLGSYPNSGWPDWYSCPDCYCHWWMDRRYFGRPLWSCKNPDVYYFMVYIFGILAGFAQNYEQLLVARTLQGLGFGGEWAVGAALMAEAVSAKHKNKAVGFVQSGMALGWAGSVIVATILITMLPPEWSWRVVLDWCHSRFNCDLYSP